MQSSSIYIALGSNLPYRDFSPRQLLDSTLKVFESFDISIVAISSFWNSPAWPDPNQPGYINAAVQVKTGFSPHDLLSTLHQIESMYGRVRGERWASRSLDIDLIDYEGRIVRDDPTLELPHPRATQRAFVLLPLQEISSQWRDPETGLQIEVLINNLDPMDVQAMSKL